MSSQLLEYQAPDLSLEGLQHVHAHGSRHKTPPHLKQLGMSSMATEVATMWMSSDSLLGAMHTMLGRLAMKVTSKEPACVEPSAPTRPARSMAKRTAGGTGGMG